MVQLKKSTRHMNNRHLHAAWDGRKRLASELINKRFKHCASRRVVLICENDYLMTRSFFHSSLPLNQHIVKFGARARKGRKYESSEIYDRSSRCHSSCAVRDSGCSRFASNDAALKMNSLVTPRDCQRKWQKDSFFSRSKFRRRPLFHVNQRHYQMMHRPLAPLVTNSDRCRPLPDSCLSLLEHSDENSFITRFVPYRRFYDDDFSESDGGDSTDHENSSNSDEEFV